MLTPSPPTLHLSAPLSQRPPSSSCQVYGSKVTMKLPACENIELQKHPWVRGCVNGAFSAGPDPLLTDGQQMAFCVQRGRTRGQREGRGKSKEDEIHTREGWGGGGGVRVLRVFRPLQSGGPICRSEMPYHMTCLTFGPHSAQAVRLLSNGEHKAPQPQRPPFTPLCSHTPKVIGKSNVSDLHFPSLYRRAKLLRFPDNVKGTEWPFWLLIHCLTLASMKCSETRTELPLCGKSILSVEEFHIFKPQKPTGTGKENDRND